MAEITEGDTHPPIRGAAADATGILDLTSADGLTFVAKQRVATGSPAQFDGAATAIAPPYEIDEDGNHYNWRYIIAAGDTDVVGDYATELVVTWDAAAVPPKVQRFPHGTLTINAKVGP